MDYNSTKLYFVASLVVTGNLKAKRLFKAPATTLVTAARLRNV